uniref:Uncharacterized protein n=1 Tax=Cucumis melo TaxID=3656 RepID=A0A9I9EBL2_CUCME
MFHRENERRLRLRERAHQEEHNLLIILIVVNNKIKSWKSSPESFPPEVPNFLFHRMQRPCKEFRRERIPMTTWYSGISRIVKVKRNVRVFDYCSTNKKRNVEVQHCFSTINTEMEIEPPSKMPVTMKLSLLWQCKSKCNPVDGEYSSYYNISDLELSWDQRKHSNYSRDILNTRDVFFLSSSENFQS